MAALAPMNWEMFTQMPPRGQVGIIGFFILFMGVVVWTSIKLVFGGIACENCHKRFTGRFVNMEDNI